VQYSVCHECQFEFDPFQKMQPVEYREGVGHVVVATKSKHQSSCSDKYGLEASLKIGRNSDKYDVYIMFYGCLFVRHNGREHDRIVDN